MRGVGHTVTELVASARLLVQDVRQARALIPRYRRSVPRDGMLVPVCEAYRLHRLGIPLDVWLVEGPDPANGTGTWTGADYLLEDRASPPQQATLAHVSSSAVLVMRYRPEELWDTDTRARIREGAST